MNNRMIKIFLSIIVLSMLLSACGSKAPEENAHKGTIAVSGAFALYPMMTVWAEKYTALYPEVVFDISAGGAGKGMLDALSGAVEIGMVSRDIKEEEIAQGAFYVPVVIDAVFPTINAANPVLNSLLSKPMSQDTFAKIFITGEYTTWGDVIGDPAVTDEIHVYTRSDACGAADTWAKFLGGTQEDLLGIGISSDPALMDTVIKDPLGIGYNNLNYAFDITTGEPVTGSLVAPIDVNSNGTTDPDELLESTEEAVQAVTKDKYPSPPARKLYLVTLGEPTGIVKEFIIWILTDGQAFVNESGYIMLTEAQTQESLDKVK